GRPGRGSGGGAARPRGGGGGRRRRGGGPRAGARRRGAGGAGGGGPRRGGAKRVDLPCARRVLVVVVEPGLAERDDAGRRGHPAQRGERGVVGGDCIVGMEADGGDDPHALAGAAQ